MVYLFGLRFEETERMCEIWCSLKCHEDLPLVFEIVDSEVNKFVDSIEGIMGSALVTTEKVKVIQYGTKRIE